MLLSKKQEVKDLWRIWSISFAKSITNNQSKTDLSIDRSMTLWERLRAREVREAVKFSGERGERGKRGRKISDRAPGQERPLTWELHGLSHLSRSQPLPQSHVISQPLLLFSPTTTERCHWRCERGCEINRPLPQSHVISRPLLPLSHLQSHLSCESASLTPWPLSSHLWLA